MSAVNRPVALVSAVEIMLGAVTLMLTAPSATERPVTPAASSALTASGLTSGSERANSGAKFIVATTAARETAPPEMGDTS